MLSRRRILTLALMCATLAPAAAAPSPPAGSLRPLERWFARYRRGKIRLGPPAAEGEMDAAFQRAAALNSVKAAGRLLEVASFRFGGDAQAERARYDRVAGSRPALVRDRALDALAAMRDPGVVAWLAAQLGRRGASPERAARRRAAAARALGRGHAAGGLYALRSALTSDPDARVRIACLEALEAIAPESVLALAAPALRDPSARVRACAVEIHRRRAELLGGSPLDAGGEALAFRLAEALDDPSWWVRLSALQGLAQARSALAVPRLIDLVRREGKRTIPQANPRVRGAAYRLLVSLTGAAIPRDDPAGWDRWWRRAGPGFRVRLPPRGPEGGHRYDFSRFYGIAIRSRRVVFVLDVSGSMGEAAGRPAAGGGSPDAVLATKLDQVRRELLATLGAMDGRTRFGIVVFAGAVRRWRNDLVPADPAGIEAARRFLGGLKAGGGTNLYGALREALRLGKPGVPDPRCGADVDEIVLLSDGRPSTGEYVSPVAIVRLVTAANRFARTAIHTVGVAAGVAPLTGATLRFPFLEELAARNGGQSRGVALERASR